MDSSRAERKCWGDRGSYRDRLPKLVSYNELKGDLQVHSNWTDGANSIRDMAEAAEKLGLEYIVVSDHSKALSIARGLDEEMLLKQGEEIDNLNEEVGITILKGVELNILKNGTLDISNKSLERLDFVGASVHSHFNLSREEMTKRILKAIKNTNVPSLTPNPPTEIGKIPVATTDIILIKTKVI